MISATTFDPSRRLDFYFRVKRAGSKTLTFVDSNGLPIDISGYGFQFNIYKNSGARTKVLSLTVGSGLTISSTGSLTISPTASNTNIDEGEYYCELYKSSTQKTYLNGTAFLHNGLFDGVSNDTTTVTISDSANDVTITIQDTLSGNGLSYAYFNFTSAQIKALNGTPILAFAAPGANKYYAFNQENFNYTYGGTPYTRNSSAGIILSYDQVTAAPLLAVGNILTLSSDSTREVFTTGLSDVNSSLYINKAVYFMLNGGSFTLGNGTLRIKVLYHIVDLS